MERATTAAAGCSRTALAARTRGAPATTPRTPTRTPARTRRVLVERGADLNHVWDFSGDNIESSLLWAAIQSGRYSDAVFLLDVGADVNGRESYARDGAMGVITHKTLAPGETLLVDTNSLVSWEEFCDARGFGQLPG